MDEQSKQGRKLSREDKLTLLRWLKEGEINPFELQAMQSGRELSARELSAELMRIKRSNYNEWERRLLPVLYAFFPYYTAEELTDIDCAREEQQPWHDLTEGEREGIIKELITPSHDPSGERTARVLALNDKIKELTDGLSVYG